MKNNKNSAPQDAEKKKSVDADKVIKEKQTESKSPNAAAAKNKPKGATVFEELKEAVQKSAAEAVKKIISTVKEADAVKETEVGAKKKSAVKKTEAADKARVKEKLPVKTAKSNGAAVNKKAVKAVDSAVKTKNAVKTEQTEPAALPIEDTASEPQQTAKKILFVTGEAGPFIRSGGLGDVAYALPKALNELGADCRIILPLYYDIPSHFKQNMEYLGTVYVTLAWRYQYCGLFKYVNEGVIYYFIDNEYYFKRSNIYGHYDDAERFAFFSKAVLEALRLIDYTPDIMHCNDWHTALCPVFLDCFYRGVNGYSEIKTVFTIHNIEFQGKYGANIITDILGLPENKYELVKYKDCSNFIKGAIECSNAVTTVSETYASEILNSYYGYGLEDILRARSYKLKGIVNGIDTSLYNPLTDTALFANYDLTTLPAKSVNKKRLLELVSLPEMDNAPLIGLVTRLTEQKGLDLIMRVIEEILSRNVQVVVLGKGDYKYEKALEDLAKKYPNKLKIIINFSMDIASKIYAGSDMFLMPSKFEPCGLSQLIAMRYGSVPIVRETGGLKDTVTPFNPVSKEGTGFTFYSYNAYDMLDAVLRAVGTYYNKEEWLALVNNGMKKDSGWKASAEKYLELYKGL